MIPQERYARNYYVGKCIRLIDCFIPHVDTYLVLALTNPAAEARTPLLAPFLSAGLSGRTESVGNYYSPYDSIHNSDDEEDAQVNSFYRSIQQSVISDYGAIKSLGMLQVFRKN